MMDGPGSRVGGRWLLAALTSSALAGPVRAQDPVGLRSGDRVRIQVGPNSPLHTGRLVRLDPDSMVLQLDGQRPPIVQVPRAAVSRAWVSAGRARSTVDGMLIGFFVGLVPGAVLGADSSTICLSLAPSTGCTGNVSGATLLAGAAVGAGVGLVIGGLVGSVLTHERWRRLELPVRVVALPAGAGGMALAVRVPL